MRYIHLEKINNSTWRLAFYADLAGVQEIVRWMRGRDVVLCEKIVEHGHLKTKATHVDGLDWE